MNALAHVALRPRMPTAVDKYYILTDDASVGSDVTYPIRNLYLR